MIEANSNPDIDVQQAPDRAEGGGKMYLYKSLIEETNDYKKESLKILGYRVNDIHNFMSSYNQNQFRNKVRLQFAMTKLIPDCESLIELGCRKDKFIKNICPENVRYYSVDFFEQNDLEFICCDFNRGFPDIKADTLFSAFTAEYIEALPQFLHNMCSSAQKQILMICRPFDKETNYYYRWQHPFVTDFTESF